MSIVRRTTIVALSAVSVAAVVTAGASDAAAAGSHHLLQAPNHRISNSTSGNWSGYAVTGGRYSTVTSNWVQPAVKCTGTAYSSFWVGIDGDTKGNGQEAGTGGDCNRPPAVFSGWYEMYPKFPTNYPTPSS